MDALMIIFAMWIMNICHPGRLLGPARAWKTENTATSADDETRTLEAQQDVFEK